MKLGMMFGRAGLWLGLLAMQGCMPERVEVGRGTDGAGDGGEQGLTGGTMGRAGSGGSAGRVSSGGRGGGGGTGGAAGRGAAAGEGPRGGSGGQGPRGGSGGNAGTVPHGGGGSAGTPPRGGAGGAPPDINPDCDCSWGELGQFNCTISLTGLSAEHFAAPSDCQLDQDYVRKMACGGFVEYTWQVGGESAYELVVGGIGPVSLKASGYVGGVCGIDDNVLGAITAGDPEPLTCGTECTVCQTDGSTLPACEQCHTSGSGSMTATESLEEYCSFHACPSSIDEATTQLRNTCGTGTTATRIDGCGFITLDTFSGTHGMAYYFDATTHELAGLTIGNDVAWGPCSVPTYEIGTKPSTACAPTCDLCGSSTGAAGATGAGGAGDGLPACQP